ncbi:unnamed protein product [Closterium sp. Yama58-4]|nr:unnamed protein product [Closterium sp. Yama58-4]
MLGLGGITNHVSVSGWDGSQQQHAWLMLSALTRTHHIALSQALAIRGGWVLFDVSKIPSLHVSALTRTHHIALSQALAIRHCEQRYSWLALPLSPLLFPNANPLIPSPSTQVLAIGGVAVLAAAVFLPRRPRQHVEALTPLQVAQRMRNGSAKEMDGKIWIVRPGDTLCSLVPRAALCDPNSEFFKRNPEVCDVNKIYSGQCLLLP